MRGGTMLVLGREVYKLDCSACGRTVTVPASDGKHVCPNCGAALQIDWHNARADLERQPA